VGGGGTLKNYLGKAQKPGLTIPDRILLTSYILLNYLVITFYHSNFQSSFLLFPVP
jgi:hypothetical protein